MLSNECRKVRNKRVLLYLHQMYYTPVVHVYVSYVNVMNLGLNYLKKLQGSKSTFQLALWRIKQTPHFTCPRQALEGKCFCKLFFLFNLGPCPVDKREWKFLVQQENLLLQDSTFFQDPMLVNLWNRNNRITRWGHLQIKGFLWCC